jgi:polyhydroxybutyrate depolymerase
MSLVPPLIALLAVGGTGLGPGDSVRSVKMGDETRTFLVHVPKIYDSKKLTPVVLILHGAFTNGAITVQFTGMNSKSDEAGFIAVYPNGTGPGESILFWNAGLVRMQPGKKQPDDVAFVGKLLDDLATVVNVDPKRVYATGISNGGMMCYRLAAELSDRIAAIAPVSGTMAIDRASPKRPVPVMHFHGLADKIVPYAGIPMTTTQRSITFKSVDDTIKIWAKIDGCTGEPKVEKLPDTAHDGTTVTKTTYGGGKNGAAVILYAIDGGGHTWPGRPPVVKFLGKSTTNINANDLIWDFFQRHPMP